MGRQKTVPPQPTSKPCTSSTSIQAQGVGARPCNWDMSTDIHNDPATTSSALTMYLGMWIDKQLSFMAHAAYLQERMQSRLNVMWPVTRLMAGATYFILCLYYVQAVCYLVDYSAPVLKVLSSYQQGQLEDHARSTKVDQHMCHAEQNQPNAFNHLNLEDPRLLCGQGDVTQRQDGHITGRTKLVMRTPDHCFTLQTELAKLVMRTPDHCFTLQTELVAIQLTLEHTYHHRKSLWCCTPTPGLGFRSSSNPFR
ncbi:hypothetical protein E2C01_015681 [Portunus trituberculatus]|uniref:Uncharacterized protein n=1 Tax=Portunus trituberculatus TaxID=210409 RepID=A0A5B7DMH4_PORTR|nr:hypothetical protein [Portunus trituberculatus]